MELVNAYANIAFDIVAWRYAIMALLVCSLLVFPALAFGYIKISKNKYNALQEGVRGSISKGLENSETEIILVDRDETIIWITKKIQEEIGKKELPNKASQINRAFKNAYENPREDFVYSKNNKVYKVVFDPEVMAYFQQNITDTMKIEETSFQNKEVVGVICINFFKNEEQWKDKYKPVKVSFENSIVEWARRNNVLASEIGSLSFLLQMRNKDFLKIKNESFSILKDVESIINSHNLDAIGLMSFAVDMKSSLEAGEKAREGIIDLARGHSSAINIKTKEDSEIIYLEKYVDRKSTGVSPEEFIKGGYMESNDSSHIDFDEIEREQNNKLEQELQHERERQTPIAIHQTEPTTTIEQETSQSEQEMETPDWLKEIISNNLSENQDGNQNITSGKFEGTLLEEMEKSMSVFCYFSNLGKKDEFLLLVFLGIMAKRMNRKCFFYSEKTYSMHYTLKNRLEEANLSDLSKNIVDAFTFRRLQKQDALYILVNVDNVNRELIDTVASHRLAYINDKKQGLLEVFLGSIKHVAKDIKLNLDEVQLLQYLSKRTRDEGGQEVLEFLQSVNVEETVKDKSNINKKLKKVKKEVPKKPIEVKEEVPKISEEKTEEPPENNKQMISSDVDKVTLQKYSTSEVDMGVTLEFTFSDVKRSFYDNIKEVKGLKIDKKILIGSIDNDISATPIEIDEVAQEFSSLKEVALLVVFATLFNNKQVCIIYSNVENINSLDIVKPFKNSSGNKRRAMFEYENGTTSVPEKEIIKILRKL